MQLIASLLFAVMLMGGVAVAYQTGLMGDLVNEYMPAQIQKHLPQANGEMNFSAANSTSLKLPGNLKVDRIMSSDKFSDLDLESQGQLGTFAGRAAELGQGAQAVLGEAVKVNEEASDKSIQQKALDHGLYLYCQQYVEQYGKE